MAFVAKHHPRLTGCLALAGALALPCVAAATPAPLPPHAKHHDATHHAAAKPVPHRTATLHAPPHHDVAKAPAAPAAAPATEAAEPPTPPAAAPVAAAPPPPTDKGTVTGLPLPRFASLRSDEVNLRSGPGTRYPIDWVYQRRDLPVEIEREFEVWRLVQDPEGTKGWVHQATLAGRRDLVVIGLERTLHASADTASAAVAKLMPGVIGRILKCDTGVWCQVQVGDYRGWLQRGEFWGTLPAEVIQ